MEKPLIDIYQALQKLIGLHRQLLDTVRREHDALVQASIKDIQDATCAKRALIEAIQQTETVRLKHTVTLSMLWRKSLRELSISQIIIAIQGVDSKGAEQFRTANNVLTVLVQRIKEQNNSNRALVERSLKHVHVMKRNVLGESVPKSNTYMQNGQKSNPVSGARLISKEA